MVSIEQTTPDNAGEPGLYAGRQTGWGTYYLPTASSVGGHLLVVVTGCLWVGVTGDMATADLGCCRFTQLMVAPAAYRPQCAEGLDDTAGGGNARAIHRL